MTTSKSLNTQKNGLVIADSGAIFSLAIIDQLEILNLLFDHIRIPIAVWKEITLDKTTDHYPHVATFAIAGVEFGYLVIYGNYR